MARKVTKKTTRKIIYQEHHPDREKYPDYTIKLRKWIHMFITRLNQFKSTIENREEIRNVRKCIDEIIKRMNKDIKE